MPAAFPQTKTALLEVETDLSVAHTLVRRRTKVREGLW